MNEVAAEYGVSESAEGDGWGCIVAPAGAGSIAAEVCADPARHDAGTALVQAIVEEMPHLQRYAGFLTRNAAERDDLVQDCLERALRSLDQFQPGTSLRRWLFVILRNLFIDGKRKEARRSRQLPLIDRDCLTVLSPQLSHLRLKEVEAAFRRLCPVEQEVIFFSVFLGVSHQIIADYMHVAVGTVKSRLARARDKLRQETDHGPNRANEERQGKPLRSEAAA